MAPSARFAVSALGVTNVQLAREFSVSPSTISKIVCGVNWSHLA
jgi:hypothetical protein